VRVLLRSPLLFAYKSLTFLAINDHWISASEDDRFEFVIRVATGVLPDVDTITEQLNAWSYEEG
jgi:death on curing protein